MSSPGTRLITLSTCSYEFTEARFVVVARKIREGEDPEVDTSEAYKNPDPLMPRVWYELYGGNNPYEESRFQLLFQFVKLVQLLQQFGFFQQLQLVQFFFELQFVLEFQFFQPSFQFGGGRGKRS